MRCVEIGPFLPQNRKIFTSKRLYDVTFYKQKSIENRTDGRAGYGARLRFYLNTIQWLALARCSIISWSRKWRGFESHSVHYVLLFYPVVVGSFGRVFVMAGVEFWWKWAVWAAQDGMGDAMAAWQVWDLEREDRGD